MKKLVIGAVVLLAFCMYAGVSHADECGGQVACSCGDTLTGHRTFTEDDNFQACQGTGLIIGKDNLNLNCADEETINSNAAGQIGIYMNGRKNILIRECRLHNFTTGVYISNSDDILIRSIRVMGNGGLWGNYGIKLYNSDSVAISNASYPWLTISISKYKYGVWVDYSDDLVIDGANFSDIGRNGVDTWQADDIKINNSVFETSSANYAAVSLGYSSNVILNEFEDNEFILVGQSYGVKQNSNSVAIDAQNNTWLDDEEDPIEFDDVHKYVYDFFDDNSLGVVVYDPIN